MASVEEQLNTVPTGAVYTPECKEDKKETAKEKEEETKRIRKDPADRPYALVLCIPQHNRKSKFHKLYCPFSDNTAATPRALRHIRTACVLKIDQHTLVPLDTHALILGSTGGPALDAHNSIREGLVELLYDAAFIVTATHGVEETLLHRLCNVVEKQPEPVRRTAEQLQALAGATLFISTETLIQTAARSDAPCVPLRHEERDSQAAFVLYVHKVFGGVLAKNPTFRRAIADLIKNGKMLTVPPQTK